jgi:hypothetical protein
MVYRGVQAYLLPLLVGDSQGEFEVLVDLIEQTLNLAVTDENERFGCVFNVPDVVSIEISM